MNFKKARLYTGLTQEEVSSFLGISRSAYTNIENERRKADYETLSKLSDLFGVSVDYLLGINDEKKPAVQKDDEVNKNEILVRSRNGMIVQKSYTDAQIQTILDMLELIPEEDDDL